MPEPPFILLDHGPLGQSALFSAPLHIITAWGPGEVAAAFREMQAAQAQGLWLAGYASYELGYVLEPKAGPMPSGRRAPLLCFGVFAEFRDAPALHGAGDLAPPLPGWDGPRYAAAFGRVAGYIAAGDAYQVNLTMPLRARWRGDAAGLYAALAQRQPVGYGALVSLSAGPVILSRSPELFFRLDRQGAMETRPMKGTLPRGTTPAADAAARGALLGSSKNRAENLMIVDLLRNDLGRLCEVGSVRVPDLYRVESYATLHQMTSRITGQLRPGTGLAAIFTALFPCGSVTGAPKIRAMQIIAELEDGPRDVYCGSIGWVGPDGSAAFNVAIRTISLFPGGEAVLNVGGGVVHDSTAEAEYEEALWKARFAQI